MANQLTVHEQEAIRTLAKQGWKIRRIAKELGVSRNTVRQLGVRSRVQAAARSR
jgi:IS30 family transposase